jgi:hypothetical protein
VHWVLKFPRGAPDDLCKQSRSYHLEK